MIEFMLIAVPRCGTTWAANWLTTDKTLCLHDPINTHHYSEYDSIESKNRVLGISCTGTFPFVDWLNKHPARKIILHRNLGEVNKSLESIGYPELDKRLYNKLNDINGIHLDWTDLFSKPKMIYEYLLELEFDQERFNLLNTFQIQPEFSKVPVNKEVLSKIISEITNIV